MATIVSEEPESTHFHARTSLVQELTSTLSTMPGNDVSNNATMMPNSTEKPYEQFIEVQAAVMIDRIYIPLVVCVGTVGNILCFVTLIFSSLRTTSTCIYMAAIAVLDCIILILDLCVLIRGIVGHTRFYISVDWTCGFHNFLFYFSIHFDVLLLMAMTVDRFIVVKFPLKAQSLCTPSSAIKVITGIGLLSFALNFQIFFTRRLGPSGNSADPLRCWYPDPEVDFFMRKIYTWIDASLYSFIPFISLLLFNILIIRQLNMSRKFNKQFKGQHNEMSSKKTNIAVDCSSVNSGMETSQTDVHELEDDTTHSNGTGKVSTISGKTTTGISRSRAGTKLTKKANTNITVMLLLVSFAFLVLTSPVVIVLLYKRYYWLPSTNSQRARARLTHAFVDNLMYTNHAVNFLLYSISGRRFRNELKQLLTRLCCRDCGGV